MIQPASACWVFIKQPTGSLGHRGWFGFSCCRNSKKLRVRHRSFNCMRRIRGNGGKGLQSSELPTTNLVETRKSTFEAMKSHLCNTLKHQVHWSFQDAFSNQNPTVCIHQRRPRPSLRDNRSVRRPEPALLLAAIKHLRSIFRRQPKEFAAHGRKKCAPTDVPRISKVFLLDVLGLKGTADVQEGSTAKWDDTCRWLRTGRRHHSDAFWAVGSDWIYSMDIAS